MSGQPYRYYTDPTKYRTMFMESLELQEAINAMNLEANKTYKATGQLPAVSQMKETRTTSEILADSMKLKTDLISAIAKVSSQQFGQLVVQRIESSPLNIDNKLLVFTAQRIDDIITNLKKLYKYGIKGDTNDAEQLLKFISKMYNDKNSVAAQTKSFMASQGINTMTKSTNIFLTLYQFLTNLSVKIIAQNKELAELKNIMDDINPIIRRIPGSIDLFSPISITERVTAELASILTTITNVLPNSPKMATAIEVMVVKYAEGVDVRQQPTPESRGQLTGIPSGFIDADVEPLDQTLFDELTQYLDYVNTSLPSIGLITSIESQIDTFFRQLVQSITNTLVPVIERSKRERDFDIYEDEIVKPAVDKAIKINIEKLADVYERLYSILLPSPEWTEFRIKQLAEMKNRIVASANRMRGPEPRQQGPPQPQPQPSQPPGAPIPPSTNVPELKRLKTKIQQLIDINDSLGGLTASEINQAIDALNELWTIDNTYDFRVIDVNAPVDEIVANLESAIRELGINGIGLKKLRGRPKGCGISKAKTYKEIVKAHSAQDKGIMETPRFVKFGKYLINTHRLNNEDILALKRPSGGNIVEIPSQKVSKNLSNVIKKMVGGELPTYSDISKLSEPEKNYLHKVSKKSNILDKFDIPAPNKDALEKDIHQFEVMKGEILAGNDNKELIQKFKAHMLKLSKNGTLPKREVHEILEDLLELNY